MGDFYELFGDDAIEAARLLDITLTSRDKNKPDPLPMAGVPWHSSASYIQRLLDAGKKVAIAEQIAEPRETKPSSKSIVRREIVRTLTPGLQFQDDSSRRLGLLARAEDAWILACADFSTGHTWISESLSDARLHAELSLLPLGHLLLTPDAAKHAPALPTTLLVETLDSNSGHTVQTGSAAEQVFKTHFGEISTQSFFSNASALSAWASLMTYALKSQRIERLEHLSPPRRLSDQSHLILGPETARHLDLLPAHSSDPTPTLFALLNRTGSSAGARMLKEWLTRPLKDPALIEGRQNCVKQLSQIPARALEALSALFKQTYDLERILGRVTTGYVNPRDTLALGRSLQLLPDVIRITPLEQTRDVLRALDEKLSPLYQKIIRAQREDAPFVSREGGIFARGFSETLDRYLDLKSNGEQLLLQLEARERETTGIPNLKVRYNRVFGYYIEVTHTHLKSVPAHYVRKQTTTGAERYITEELKKLEDELLNGETRQKTLEAELFSELVTEIRLHAAEILRTAETLAELDVLSCLATWAREPGWCFPVIDRSLRLEILQGRHPMVAENARGAFVPNSVLLATPTHPERILMITGPNMGGKSTYMRQVALLVLLGQIGAPIPAESAHWGAVSSLYTRIGAHDAIARGQSTFMVEMSELAHILHHADERSLVILDEIGRGTSTYDGLSVAWATLEWMSAQVRARTLFATHYHEVTSLSASNPLIANAHMAVTDASGKLRFLFEVRPGAANESYGIQVAQMAGLPKPLIKRAWSVLEELEALKTSHDLSVTGHVSIDQLSLFAAPERSPVHERLETIDPNSLTPLQALSLVVDLKALVQSAEAPAKSS